MNDDVLIHTERRWLPRLIDATLTLIAWAAFVYLFLNGFIAVLEHKPSAQEHLHFGLLFATVSTLAFYLIIGLVNALVLMSWAKYNQIRRRVERRNRIPALTSEQLRGSFDLPEHLLQTLRGHQICTIYNDEEGRIVGAAVGSVYDSTEGPQVAVRGVARAKIKRVSQEDPVLNPSWADTAA
jgi:biofilm PGA synthesis protein PgaD